MLLLPAPCTRWGRWQGELGAGSATGASARFPKRAQAQGARGKGRAAGRAPRCREQHYPGGSAGGQGSAARCLRRPAASPAPAGAGRRIWLARPRAAESAREDACEPVNDLQICSGIVHAGFACGPHRAPGTGSAASPAGVTAAAGGGSRLAARPPLPHPSPASLRTINRPHTQLRSLSPRSEPQMYFMGERRPRQVVKHPRGCRRCARRWALACRTRAWGAREPAGACRAGGLRRRRGAVQEGGGLAAPRHPPAPQQPWAALGPWHRCRSPRLTRAARPAVLQQRA